MSETPMTIWLRLFRAILLHLDPWRDQLLRVVLGKDDYAALLRAANSTRLTLDEVRARYDIHWRRQLYGCRTPGEYTYWLARHCELPEFIKLAVRLRFKKDAPKSVHNFYSVFEQMQGTLRRMLPAEQYAGELVHLSFTSATALLVRAIPYVEPIFPDKTALHSFYLSLACSRCAQRILAMKEGGEVYDQMGRMWLCACLPQAVLQAWEGLLHEDLCATGPILQGKSELHASPLSQVTNCRLPRVYVNDCELALPDVLPTGVPGLAIMRPARPSEEQAAQMVEQMRRAEGEVLN